MDVESSSSFCLRASAAFASSSSSRSGSADRRSPCADGVPAATAASPGLSRDSFAAAEAWRGGGGAPRVANASGDEEGGAAERERDRRRAYGAARIGERAALENRLEPLT